MQPWGRRYRGVGELHGKSMEVAEDNDLRGVCFGEGEAALTKTIMHLPCNRISEH